MSEEINENVPATVNQSTDIQAALAAALPPVRDTKVMEEMAPTWDSAPFVRLVQSQSPLTLPPHRMNAGTFVLHKNKNEVIDLGESIDVVIVDWRPKAMHIDQATKKVTVEYDRESEKFHEIQEAAKARAQGYFWGFEFLIYLNDVGEHVHLYCNNLTLQNVARSELIHYMQKAVTLKSHMLKKESTGHQWFAFSCSECTAPPQVPIDLEEMKEHHAKFTNPESFQSGGDSGGSDTASADTRDR